MTALTKHYSNPAALAFPCEHPNCLEHSTPAGVNCWGDSHSKDGRYQHFMHKIRTDKVRGEPMPASQEEWEQIAAQIRASLGVQP